LPEHIAFRTDSVVKIVEEPCDYKENNFERYYPVKTADASHQRLYDLYLGDANRLPNIEFIGRCGTYMYLDMHQVINQSLISARKWLASRG
jgi:UDP-galactopyranose mutase